MRGKGNSELFSLVFFFEQTKKMYVLVLLCTQKRKNTTELSAGPKTRRRNKKTNAEI